MLQGYSDADWGGDVDKSKSTSGWLLLIGNGVVSWSSKKQTIIAQSTMEAEYVSLSEAAKEAIWLKNFLVELAIPEVEARITLYCDNQAAIWISKNPKKDGNTKHIEKIFH